MGHGRAKHRRAADKEASHKVRGGRETNWALAMEQKRSVFSLRRYLLNAGARVVCVALWGDWTWGCVTRGFEAACCASRLC